MIPKTQFSLRLNVRTHAKIKKMADAESRSLNNMLEYIIKKEIAAHEEKHGEITLTDEDLWLE